MPCLQARRFLKCRVKTKALNPPNVVKANVVGSGKTLMVCVPTLSLKPELLAAMALKFWIGLPAMLGEATKLPPLKLGAITAKYDVSLTVSLKNPPGARLLAIEDPAPLSVFALDAAFACNDRPTAASIINDRVFMIFSLFA